MASKIKRIPNTSVRTPIDAVGSAKAKIHGEKKNIYIYM
jgi:hypothetical protein